jgi:L-threonylcarbamoyladenylate synthase
MNKEKNLKSIISILKSHGIGVMPTDTIYGLVGSAFSRLAVERIYKLRKRNRKKPMIILISSIGDLKLFGIKLTPRLRKFLDRVWPGPVSVIMKISDKQQAKRDKFKYLHRGTNSLALRLPKPVWLRNTLKQTGPLVAPSANIEGKEPAYTIAEAKKYFGSRADFYLDRGRLYAFPSILIEVKR